MKMRYASTVISPAIVNDSNLPRFLADDLAGGIGRITGAGALAGPILVVLVQAEDRAQLDTVKRAVISTLDGSVQTIYGPPLDGEAA